MMIQYMFLIFQNPVWSVCESLPPNIKSPQMNIRMFRTMQLLGSQKIGVLYLNVFDTYSMPLYTIILYTIIYHYIPLYYIPLYTIIYHDIHLYTIVHHYIPLYYIALYPCYILTKWLSRNHHLSSWGWLIITSFSLVN